MNIASVLPAAPTSATVQQISGTSFELNWDAQAGVDGFVIAYATAEGTTITNVELPADRTSYQVTNLVENTDYQFFLYSETNGLRTRAQLTLLDPDTTAPGTKSIRLV